MSPEQFEGRPVDVRSDLYALGCVSYFALTGYYPFTGKNVPEVICSHLQRRMAPLREMRPDLSPELCAWVNRLMATYPESRPNSAAEALAELDGLPPETPVPVPRVSVPAPASPPTGGHRWAGIAVAAAVLVLCGIYLQTQRKAPAPAEPAKAEMAASTP
jgi:serine/threonine-protein kinase